MTARRMTAGLAAAALLGVSTAALADHERGLHRATAVSLSGYAQESGRRSGPVYDYARVISAEPIVRYVTVTTPVRECWQETEYYTVDRPVPGAGASTLVGAIVGGVVGHQFGSGRGNDAATIAGTLIGAAIGNDTARHRYGADRVSTEYGRPVRRCETRAPKRRRNDGPRSRGGRFFERLH